MCKYRYPNYWKKKVRQGDTWLSPSNQIYKQNDLIFIGQILNSYSGQQESVRLLFEDIKAVTGFVQYIFLPTAFIGYFMIEEMDPKTIMIGDDSFSEILDQLPLREELDSNTIGKMKEILATLESSWELGERETFLKLEQALRLLETFSIDHVITSFNVLKSPSGLATWLVNEYENEPILGVHSLEQEVNMNINEFIQLSKEAESEPFQSKRFFHSLDGVMIL
ncbi:hypothetical protein [Halalkalibacter alkalisediminis]|uniref:Uncharacterized protein n=1 Tax=Halalkalibacter alkalisediminis TaxID=935616 RepID=A0ABV6NDI5_9BACI|nr:hypothetical protein [Halalkalibacter alkalisediminis]